MAFIMVLVFLVLCSAFIVLTTQANRKIPVQHARRMVGRKVMQGGNTFLPLKLNTAGVIPVIFSSAILSFPQFMLGFMPGWAGRFFNDWFTMNSSRNLYNFLVDLTGSDLGGGVFHLLRVVNLWTITYALLTAFFCFFYTALTFNPVDLADNLKKSGAFIPGRKPGKQTSDYINYILLRITVVGALSLVTVAMIPEVFHVGFDIPFMFAQLAGGTGLIIVVGVVLDTMKQIESQLLMRHYDGFRYRGAATGGGTSGRRRVRKNA
jgi:preprotein translocase subunit SecY